MMEVCGPEAVYCLLKAAHAMFRAQQVSTPEHTDASLGPMLEQKIWVWHVLHVAESQGRFSGLGDFVLFCTLCFVLFNLCAVCMNELLSIFREPGSGGAVPLSDPNPFLDISCHLSFPVISTGEWQRASKRSY